MALRNIHIWPDPALKEVAKAVPEVNDEIRTLVQDMFETMYDANGVGLAANQVGIPKRVLVIDLDPKGEGKEEAGIKEELESWGFSRPMAFINPEIVAAEGSVTWEEGCLSVPGIVEEVKRREKIRVKALNPDGSPFEVEATGLFSVALQHEMDHLDGKVFVEYLSKLKRDVIRRKMNRLKSDAEEQRSASA